VLRNGNRNDEFYSNPESFTDPETRGLAEVLRRLERLVPRNSSLHWSETRQRNIEALQKLSQLDDRTDRLIDLLDGVEYEVGGDEHLLFRVDKQPHRIYKATYGDNLGCCSKFDPIDPELTGKNFNATGNISAEFYFRRWILLNSLGGYKIRFEGILPPELPDWLPRICISQPWLEGNNPRPDLVAKLMRQEGFSEVSQDSFYSETTGILLTDAAPRNVRISEGRPIPFDAIAEVAADEVVRWIKR
jgi:hypothetical protein